LKKNEFQGLGLTKPLFSRLSRRNHLNPTPIQKQAIPSLLEGRDLLGIAQTGTGKTGAFSLPILQKILDLHWRVNPHRPKALVLAPTRELAIQIGQEIEAYKSGLPIRHTVIFGGVSQIKQVEALKRGVHIIIATPGRLLDLKMQGQLELSEVQIFVLDEADRMLDMGFIRDIKKIAPALPAVRQSMMFSATMPPKIAQLAAELLVEPVRVEVSPQAKPIEQVAQYVCRVPASRKRRVLEEIVAHPNCERVIIFVKMKHRTNRIADQLRKVGIETESINGNKSQNARQTALRRFKEGQIQVLVATDIASRGIDVDGITHVINYDLPNEPEAYVHRIGRTARAGKHGTAVSLCDDGEVHHLRSIEKLIGEKISLVEEKGVAQLLDKGTGFFEPNVQKKKTRNKTR